MKCAVFTWNVHGTAADKKQTEKIATLLSNTNAHLIVIGLQEIGSLLYPFHRQAAQVDLWIHHMAIACKPYRLISHSTLCGLLLFCFIHQQCDAQFIGSGTLGCGLFSLYGNKGGVGIALKLGSITFGFLNLHLIHGTQKSIVRTDQLLHILSTFRFGTKSIHDLDCIFLLGDLNYRLSLSRNTTIASLHDKNTQSLLEYDELYQEIQFKGRLSFLIEPRITFPPTYKINENGEYHEKRCPAYCDRILFYSETISCRNSVYTSHPEFCTSDHKPVSLVAEFAVDKTTSLEKKLGVVVREEYYVYTLARYSLTNIISISLSLARTPIPPILLITAVLFTLSYISTIFQLI